MKRLSLGLFVLLALAVSVGLGVAVSPWADSSPDGLEKVAENKGFLEDGRLHGVQENAPVPDYAFPGIDNPRVATGVAGFVGVLIVAAAGTGLAFLARRRTPRGREEEAPAGAV